MEKINLLLYVAHVLDPRTKLEALQYYLVKCSGLEWAKQIETNVKDLLNRLWEQYNKLYGRRLSNFDAGVESSTVTSIDVSVVDDDEDILTETKYMKSFIQHLEEENNSECMSEVDRYFFGWV
jgi:glutathionylspermidine synthase